MLSDFFERIGMSEAGDGKRRHERVVFTPDDDVRVSLLLPGKVLHHAPLMNLSIGGLLFILGRKMTQTLKVGDRLTLMGICGAGPRLPIPRTEIEVRYILDLHFYNSLSIGCAFCDIDADMKESLRRWVQKEGA